LKSAARDGDNEGRRRESSSAMSAGESRPVIDGDSPTAGAAGTGAAGTGAAGIGAAGSTIMPTA
jgi:hypothetical protein